MSQHLVEVWRLCNGQISLCCPRSVASENFKKLDATILGTKDIEITPPKKKKTVYRYAVESFGGTYEITSHYYENSVELDLAGLSVRNFQRLDFTAKEIEE